jgi:ribosomal protein S18 acetylase RimI-like enzyme
VDAIVDRIDAYCDAVPRRTALVEELGALVVFLRQGDGWPFYARPRRGGPQPTAADVERARRRQREAAVPEAFEWVDDVSPAMRDAAVAGGLAVGDHPLMVQSGDAAPRPLAAGVEVRLATPDDDIATITSVAVVGFAHPGTSVGPQGRRELAAAAATRSAERDSRERERLGSGALVLAVAFLDGAPVATGVHQPVGGVTEIAGVATLPSARRRGLGAAVTALLVEDARRRGLETVFLTAGSEEIARLYASLGFERVGTACIAGPG